MKKRMRLTRGLKKLSAVQKKLMTEILAKNGMLKPLAYVYVEIVAIPYKGHMSDDKVVGIKYPARVQD